MYRHRIPKATVNKLRRLYIAGPFNKKAAAAWLKISSRTVYKYLEEFEQIRLNFPGRLTDMDFFMPNPEKSHRETNMYTHFTSVLPGLLEESFAAGNATAAIWKKYSALYPEGYTYTPFRRLFSSWRKANHIVTANAQLIKDVPVTDWLIIKNWRNSYNLRNWRIAVVLQSAYERKSLREISDKVEIDIVTVKRWIRTYNQDGLAALAIKKRRLGEAITKAVQQKSVNITKLLQRSPKFYGVNKTAWTLTALAETYRQIHGRYISANCVLGYLKKLGYSYKKTREMLSSPDPKFDQKIKRIQEILTKLGPDEKFFSIDELGPVNIRSKGGRSFIHKSEPVKIIPKFQKKKGTVTCIAALELSANQVTHFYAPRKDSTEMIRLVDLLLSKYSGEKSLYLSWDAVSWHNSIMLKEHLKQLNSKAYRQIRHTPLLKMAPLPSCTQYLNVIESVFKGLVRSVIHNSDYNSAGECQMAIDRYFLERNRYFMENPKRAGDKIWGKEIVKPVFSETQHCKKPITDRGTRK
jgi:transposase